MGIAELQKVFGLNTRQAAFCLEYLQDLNATASYKRAGYKPRSDNAAAASASKLLRNHKIEAALELLKARRSRKLEITSEAVLEELARLAFSELSDAVEWGPSGVILKPSDDLPEEIRAAIQEVSETVQGGLKIKLHSKTKALELLCRHLDIAPARVELTAGGKLKDALDALTAAGLG